MKVKNQFKKPKKGLQKTTKKTFLSSYLKLKKNLAKRDHQKKKGICYLRIVNLRLNQKLQITENLMTIINSKFKPVIPKIDQ